MTERAFRLDFFIAIGALLISALTAAALIYQTRVIADQYAAAIWPYVSVNATYSPNGEQIVIANDGLGPALIESAQLAVDGKNVATWNEYFRTLLSEPQVQTLLEHLVTTHQPPTISSASIGPGTTIRPGDTKPLLAISYSGQLPLSAVQEHKLSIELCYCSLNGKCWNLRATPGTLSRTAPLPVAHCASDAAIGSDALLPAVHLRKKMVH